MIGAASAVRSGDDIIAATRSLSPAHPALQGLTLEGNKVTLFPGEVPSQLPEKSFWLDQGFNFQQFKPLSHRADNPLVHTRVDKALEYLIGDKLK